MDAPNDVLRCNVCHVKLEEREYIFDEVSQKEKLIITLPIEIPQDDNSEYTCWDCHERVTNYYEFAQNVFWNSKENFNMSRINSLFEVNKNEKIEMAAISNLYKNMIYTCPNCNINLKILIKDNSEDSYYPFQISLIVVDQEEKLTMEKNMQICEDTREVINGACKKKSNLKDELHESSLNHDIVRDITNEQNINNVQNSSVIKEDINIHDFMHVLKHSKENVNTTELNSLFEANENERIEMMTFSKLYSDIIYSCPNCNIDLMILIRSNPEDCKYPFQILLAIVDQMEKLLKNETCEDIMDHVNEDCTINLNTEEESLLNQDIDSDIDHEKSSTKKEHKSSPILQENITFQKRKILRRKGGKKRTKRKLQENDSHKATTTNAKKINFETDTDETKVNQAEKSETAKIENQEEIVKCSLCREVITDLDPDAINDLVTCAACEDSALSLMVDGYQSKAISRRQYQCSICPKRFVRKERLEFHEMRHNENMNEFICSTCGNEFSAENSLYEHYLFVHKGARPHICELCGKSYQIKARLKEHLRTHTGEKPYQCDVCGMRCMTVNALKGHRKSHFSHSRHTCNICHKSYSKKQNMNEHLEKHWKIDKNISLPRLFTCPLCTEGLPTYRLLKYHMMEIHKIDRQDPLVTSQQPLYECNECHEKFKHQMSLKAHKEKVHEGRADPTFECDTCNATFRMKQMLINHIKNKHGGEKRYKCAQCGKGFSGTKSLYNHILLHTGRKPFSCEYCNMRFRRKDSRDLHRRKHTNEQPFQCQDCDQSFSTYNNRSKHRKKEHGEGKTEWTESFVCTECGDKCDSQQEVRIHMNKHLGEKLNKLFQITQRIPQRCVK